MALLIIQTIDTVFRIFFWLILIRAILSWIRPATYNRFLSDVTHVVTVLTDPILAPIRRLMPPMVLDFSPFIAMILLNILQGVVRSVLWRILA